MYVHLNSIDTTLLIPSCFYFRSLVSILGIAPIRGLLMKRSYFKSRGERLGPAFLIFGSRCSEEGLFHEEIKQFQKDGVLTKTWMCYSREPGKPKEYTGDKLGSDRVKTVLSPVLVKVNTHIYICGSANMAGETKDECFCLFVHPFFCRLVHSY